MDWQFKWMPMIGSMAPYPFEYPPAVMEAMHNALQDKYPSHEIVMYKYDDRANTEKKVDASAYCAGDGSTGFQIKRTDRYRANISIGADTLLMYIRNRQQVLSDGRQCDVDFLMAGVAGAREMIAVPWGEFLQFAGMVSEKSSSSFHLFSVSELSDLSGAFPVLYRPDDYTRLEEFWRTQRWAY